MSTLKLLISFIVTFRRYLVLTVRQSKKVYKKIPKYHCFIISYMDGKVAGLPIDLRTESVSQLVAERYAWLDDDDVNTLKGDPELIAADDKARRARGYMKGPASALVSGGTKTLRQAHNAARIILGTFTLGEGDHWIRFKNTEENLSTEFMHNYLELVPKSIISDPSKPEDKN